jgi:hypothetical protein
MQNTGIRYIMCICFLFARFRRHNYFFSISHFDKCLGNHRKLIQCGDSRIIFILSFYPSLSLSPSRCVDFWPQWSVIKARKCALKINILAYCLLCLFVMARAIYRFLNVHTYYAQFKQAKNICPWLMGLSDVCSFVDTKLSVS